MFFLGLLRLFAIFWCQIHFQFLAMSLSVSYKVLQNKSNPSMEPSSEMEEVNPTVNLQEDLDKDISISYFKPVFTCKAQQRAGILFSRSQLC